MAFQFLSLERRDAVATITLRRPRAGNALNEAMAREIEEAARTVQQDEGVRVVVLTGEGGGFCVGMEPGSILRDYAEHYAPAYAISRIEKPVIAAINGDALGQGLELALACDLRLAADGARLAITQVTQGLLPWDGGTQRLARLVGRGKALEMLLTGEAVEAREAQRLGLVNQVMPREGLASKTQELASRLAAHAPIAARYAKEAILKGMDMTLEQGLRLEADLSIILQTTEDRAEGLAAFLERRPPRFKGV